MAPWLTNLLTGLAQVVIPSALMFAMGKGWIDPSTIGGLISVMATVAGAGHSAATTTVTK